MFVFRCARRASDGCWEAEVSCKGEVFGVVFTEDTPFHFELIVSDKDISQDDISRLERTFQFYRLLVVGR